MSPYLRVRDWLAIIALAASLVALVTYAAAHPPRTVVTVSWSCDGQ